MTVSLDATKAAATPLEVQRQAKLIDAAQDFEATMLQELLKPMQHGGETWGEDDNSGDTSSNSISTFGTEALAKAISKAGGFGIASKVTAQVSTEHQRAKQK
jgi:flagellar protein FlgJ